jgi:hypothetical protein
VRKTLPITRLPYRKSRPSSLPRFFNVSPVVENQDRQEPMCGAKFESCASSRAGDEKCSARPLASWCCGLGLAPIPLLIAIYAHHRLVPLLPFALCHPANSNWVGIHSAYRHGHEPAHAKKEMHCWTDPVEWPALGPSPGYRWLARYSAENTTFLSLIPSY